MNLLPRICCRAINASKKKFPLHNQCCRRRISNTKFTQANKSVTALNVNNLKPIKSPYQKNMEAAKSSSAKSKWSLTSLLVGFGTGSVCASVYFNQLVHVSINLILKYRYNEFSLTTFTYKI